MAVQEDHDLPDGALLRPPRDDGVASLLPDAGYFLKPMRFGLDHVEHLLLERGDQLLGVDRADAADHAGAKIFLDSLDRRRRHGLQKPRPKLDAVRAIVAPLATGLNELAGGDRRGMANDRDQIALAPRLDAQDAETVVVVVERHALDEPSEDFRAGVGRRFQA